MVAIMAESAGQVRPKLQDKADVSVALAKGWLRMVDTYRKGSFADALEVDPKTVGRALDLTSTPALHTAMNSLLVDETALNELFALYGFHPPRRRMARPINDMHTLADLSGLVSRFCSALEDGERDHQETLALAQQIAPIMPALTAILNEAHKLHGIECPSGVPS